MVKKTVSSASETVPYVSVEDRGGSNLYGRPEPKAFSSRIKHILIFIVISLAVVALSF